MKNAILIAACFAAGLAGANVQPILTGAGKLIFPEATPAATLSASSGALTVAAGGSNKNITLTPSGTGGVTVPGSSAAQSNAGGLFSLTTPASTHGLRMGVYDSNYSWLQSYDSLHLEINPAGNWMNVGGAVRTTGGFPVAPASGVGVEMEYTAGAGYVWSYDRAGSAMMPLNMGGNPLILNGGSVCVNQSACTYALDTLGDTNTSGVYRKGGAAGVGTGSTITVCTSGACATSCTLIFNGGIRTGGNCP
jgi:hypothetical protein